MRVSGGMGRNDSMSDPIENQLTIAVTGIVGGAAMIGTGVVTLTPAMPPDPPEPTPPPEDDTTPLSVRVDYQGASYVFDEETGVALRDYEEPGGHFIQRCVLCTLPELPGFRVFFRRDRGAPRDEVVFELGSIFTGAPAHMQGYVATIMRDSEMLAVIDVPAHYWNDSWRWFSAPRPIIYPAAGFLGSMLPAYSETLFGSAIPLSTPRTYAGPMDLAGITAYIPSTGERDEIGACTEAQAEFLCTGSDVAWASVLAQAEASGSIPLHFRDENTHAPLDWTAYPNATMYGTTGDPLVKNPADSPVVLDSAHMGSFCFAPFLLTGDPYYLEWLQFCAVYNVICLSPGARQNYSLGNAIRAVAWALRSLVQAATVTPDHVPDWLLPKALFKARLDDQKKWFMDRYVNGSELPCADLWILQTPVNSPGSATSVPPAGTYIAPWQEDFLSCVLGWVVAMGHSDWLPILEWKAQDTKARTGGTSGWVRAVPTLYQLMTREGPSGLSVTTWADAWEMNERCLGDPCAYDDPNTFSATANITYTSYALGALAFEALAGVDGAAGCYDWLLSQMQASTTRDRYSRRKWSMAYVTNH
jgi:hypothetical protein